ncbi:MAG TPA: FHA domain-containing protein [Rubrivivax sp.]|nr:FHA domain-containing protein [Rubrivivax sp.]
MSLFDKLARWLGLSETASAEMPLPSAGGTSSGLAMPPPAVPPVPAALGGHGAYAELWQSVDRHLSQFMVRSVLPHRQFEPDDVFRLVRIQITGTTAAARAAIDQFLHEFRPESRRKVVLAAVQRNCPQGVSTDDFVDFNRDFESADLQDSDPYDAQLAPSHQGGFQLTLYGEWQLRPSAPATSGVGSAAAGLPGQGTSAHGQTPLHIAVNDATGQRTLQVAELPFVVGRSASQPKFAITGQFVSRRHGLIERDSQGRLWFRDTSVNGSSLDGVLITPGDRRQLANGARLRLGGDVANPRECPELVVQWPPPADATDDHGGGQADLRTPIRAPLRQHSPENTPLRHSSHDVVDAAGGAPTPLVDPAPGPLCLLAVKDAHGSRTVPVTRLPFVIGRGEQADCRIPEDNAGVSRDHLVLRGLSDAGAQVENHAAGKWGTEVDGAEQPAQFTLAWGGQATLAGRFGKAPPATVQLLPSTR